jgi:hypothetical protein
MVPVRRRSTLRRPSEAFSTCAELFDFEPLSEAPIVIVALASIMSQLRHELTNQAISVTDVCVHALGVVRGR